MDWITAQYGYRMPDGYKKPASCKGMSLYFQNCIKKCDFISFYITALIQCDYSNYLLIQAEPSLEQKCGIGGP